MICEKCREKPRKSTVHIAFENKMCAYGKTFSAALNTITLKKLLFFSMKITFKKSL
jgi:hypothetical protein